MQKRYFVTWVLAVLTAGDAFAQHDADLWIGVSADGQLRLSPLGLDPAAEIFRLPPATGLFQGFSSNDPGFDDIEADDPDNDIYRFEPGHAIGLEVLALDPALLIWNTGLSRFDVGQIAPLGSTNSGIHTHLIWHINTRAPSPYDPLRTVWRATLRLVDTTGGYTPSDPFTLYFRANMECTLGDANGDEEVNNFDIDTFVAVLTNPVEATTAQRCAADVNLDGYVNNFDIDPFVALLTGG